MQMIDYSNNALSHLLSLILTLIVNNSTCVVSWSLDMPFGGENTKCLQNTKKLLDQKIMTYFYDINKCFYFSIYTYVSSSLRGVVLAFRFSYCYFSLAAVTWSQTLEHIFVSLDCSRRLYFYA